MQQIKTTIDKLLTLRAACQIYPRYRELETKVLALLLTPVVALSMYFSFKAFIWYLKSLITLIEKL